jgi:hypothetical protein
MIIRPEGPVRFVVNNWDLNEDPTFKLYYTQARQLGYKSISGYVVYMAGIDSVDLQNSEVLLKFADDVQGCDFPVDYLIADDEVDTWWSGSTKITATGFNQVLGVPVLFEKFWKELHKVPMHYSARRHMNKYKTEYMTWLDNVNVQNINNAFEDVQIKSVLNWYAWYYAVVQNATKIFADAADLMDELPINTQAQENSYLNIGSYSLFNLHQFSDNWRPRMSKVRS